MVVKIDIHTGLTRRSDTNTRFRAYVTAIPALNPEFVIDRLVNPVYMSFFNFLALGSPDEIN